MSNSSNQPSVLNGIAGILGGIGGFALSRYCGSAVWVPGAALLLFIFLFVKTPLAPKHFRGAIAATAAHITWFIVGSAITSDWSAAGLDIIFLTVGVIWLWVNPGLLGALFLGSIQLFCLAINVQALMAEPVGSAGHRALTAHCVFRAIAVICLFTGYFRMRRERAGAPLIGRAI